MPSSIVSVKIPEVTAGGNTAQTWSQFMGSIRNPHVYERVAVHGAKIILICLAAAVIARIGQAMVNRTARTLIETEERRENYSQAARQRTLAGLLRSVVRYGVYFFAFISILTTWDVHVLGLLGTAGVLGVVVGFGAQKLVRDVITGVFILIEDQYSVGDTVTISAVTGVVEDIGVRVTRIRDEIGRLNILPNGDINQVMNHSRGRLEAMVEVSVPLDQDLAAVHSAVASASTKALIGENTALQEAATVEGITALDGTKITLRIGGVARSGQQKAAEMALRGALRDEFPAAGIKLV